LFNTVLILLQLFVTLVMGIYFFNMLRGQHTSKSGLESDSARELEKLRRLKQIRLTQPLAEKTRPQDLSEVVGQKEGIRALKAALCGPNPQHVLIYGPPGVGKTAAARAVLKEAIEAGNSPFRQGAKFVEMDATTLRFDERGNEDMIIQAGMCCSLHPYLTDAYQTTYINDNYLVTKDGAVRIHQTPPEMIIL